VNVTVVEPPQASGAPVLSFVKTPLQPLALAVASQAVKASFTAVWVWHDATVVLEGQVKIGASARVIVTSSVVAVQGPLDTVQRKTLSPTARPVMVEVGLLGDEIVPAPLTSDHVPVP
jgi:hypothetical protein